jgi:cell division protein FtsZ
MFELEENPMQASFELEETFTPSAVIKVVGVGGAGGNAVNRMVEAGVRGVQFIAMNTDMQVLAKNLATSKLQLGAKLTGGKGVGADPEKGRQAALESEDEIAALLKGADMVFVAAGMGKGTGTGAAPVVAEISRRLGILTIPVVTRPFQFEGAACLKRAEAGLEALSKVTDSTLVIHNDKIMAVAARVPLSEALRQADDTLRHAIQSISDVVTSEGLMNCDFNDVRSIMNERGGIYMGVGAADGEEAASRAAEMALANPYLEGGSSARSLAGATGMLVMISVKDESRFTASDLEAVLQVMAGRASRSSREVNMIHGLAYNPSQDEDLRVTVIAAGFEIHDKDGKAPAHDWMAGLNLSGVKPARENSAPVAQPSAEDLDIPAFMRRRHVESMEKAAKAA